VPMAYRDSVALYYEDVGQGEPPVVLVHGWCCDHSYLAPQAEHYARDHRVVSVDLRGHGRSDKPQQAYTMAGFADDLAWLFGELELAKPLVIGHSMGGLIALDLAARHPELSGAIVLLDSPAFLRQELAPLVAPVLEAMRTPAYREAAAGFVSQVMFLPGDESERKRAIVEGMTQAPQHVMAACLDQIPAFDAAAAAAAVRVPVLYVAATLVTADLDAFRAARPDLVTGQTVGAGHFHQLEVPEQVNAMIDSFLATAARQTALTGS
jgi:pimeloyl-ACP methyl ester carboxylesterase